MLGETLPFADGNVMIRVFRQALALDEVSVWHFPN
jgi:hypothetical protein